MDRGRRLHFWSGVAPIGAALLLASNVGWGQQIPDGGPGGACTDDSDCGICGWVCSVARGNICIPGAEGDPGHCTIDAGCECPGQVCSGASCTPAAKPECWCNGDCPINKICDQLLFTCLAQSAISCGKSYHGYDFGPISTGPSCGCNSICGGGSDAPYCQTQAFWFPPECSSDMDCGSCYQGWVCTFEPGFDSGLKFCNPTQSDLGWCTDQRDVSPTTGGATSGSSSGTSGGATSGSGSGTSGSSTGGTSAEDGGTLDTRRGCGCGAGFTSTSEGSTFLAVGFFIFLRRRRCATRSC
jgi:hypothetical protein